MEKFNPNITAIINAALSPEWDFEEENERLSQQLELSDKRVKVLKAENARLYKCIDEITVERLKMAQYIEFLTTDNAKHIQAKQELLEEIQELQHMLDPRSKPKQTEPPTPGVQPDEPAPGQLSMFNLDEFIEELGRFFK